MKQIEELLTGRTDLDAKSLSQLKNLAADWQLIADLSFADLALWVELDSGKFISIAQVRAATAATVFPKDFVGEERDALPKQDGVELFPITFQDRVIAHISRHRNPEVVRSIGRLESSYQEIAQILLDMAKQGAFPYQISISALNPSPRVGDGFIRLNKSGEIVYASPNGRSAFSRLGWESELEGIALVEIASEISGESKQKLHEKVAENSVTQIELSNRGGVIELTLLPLLNSGVRLGTVVLIHNVTEMRRRERELLLKDATIKEIHHRVKNNLQTVSALLRLQARRVEDLTARGALDEAVRRISSIALVHETLSASGKDEVDFDSVVDSLIGHAAELALRAPGSTAEISVKRLGSIGALDPKIATPLALIITELIANAIEHGITTRGSKVDVIFSRTGQSCVVKVEDDGVGLPKDFDLKSSSNLGLQIVRTLTESELHGTLELSTNITNTTSATSANNVTNAGGTTAQLRFEIR